MIREPGMRLRERNRTLIGGMRPSPLQTHSLEGTLCYARVQMLSAGGSISLRRAIPCCTLPVFLLCSVLRLRSEGTTTEVSGGDVESDVTVVVDYSGSSGSETALNSTSGAGFHDSEQDAATTLIEEDMHVRSPPTPPPYFHPDFVPAASGSDDDVVVFDVDSVLDGERLNATGRYAGGYYVDPVVDDDDDQEARDLERVVVVVQSAVTSRVTSSESLVVSDGRPTTVAVDSEWSELGHVGRPSSPSSSVLWTTSTKNLQEDASPSSAGRSVVCASWRALMYIRL